MEYDAAKNELESYGNIKFYYESLKRSLNSYMHNSNDKKQAELDRLAREMQITEEQISSKIEKIASPYNAILYHRFILLMKPNELSRKFSYTPQHIRRLICAGILKYAALG